MVFAPWCYGHHPIYLQHLIRYWCEQKLPGVLDIVVSLEFMREHSDVVEMASISEYKSVKIVAMTAQEQANLEAKNYGFTRSFYQYELIAKYANLMNSKSCLILYFDSCQLPLAWKAKLPCSCSGIYFRPTFHYSNFANYVPTWKERLQQWREKFFIYRILQHPQFKTLFCLDPFVVEPINYFCNRVRAVHLPDPVQAYARPALHAEDLKKSLEIHPNRRVFFSFGRLADARKGIPQLIEAVSKLPPELCKKLCLLFVGEPDPAGKEKLESWLTPLRQSRLVQIVSHYGFVPESEVQSYFQLADVVLAPYQRHVGMSGILMLAAAAQKPVLSSDYGLMGEIVRRYSLGLAVDSTKPSEIAKGLTRLLLESPENLGDRAQMKSFAEQNSAEQFARVIFENI